MEGTGISRWIYDERDLPVKTTRVEGSVRVAYEMFEPLIAEDPLKIVRAWVRLVIWKNAQGQEKPHVNIASKLDDLLRANLQDFQDLQTGKKYALYLTDYRTLEFQDQNGTAPWPYPIAPPKAIQHVLAAMNPP